MENEFDINDAVKLAFAQYKKFADWMPASNLRLEETVFESGKWHITVSADEPMVVPLRMFKRIYKTFEIDPKSKSVVGMHIRNLDPAA